MKQLGLAGEKFFCGPVSSANGIVNLAQNGYPDLLRNETPRSLIDTLATYFKTDEDGTITNNLCRGLDKFVESKGYKSLIQYQGFRPIDSKYKISNVPHLDWINNKINSREMVVLNLGVYNKDASKNLYSRQYGHFVLATGAGHNGFNVDPSYLTIRDPNNPVLGSQYIKAKEIPQGKLVHNDSTDNEPSLSDKASGFFEIAQKFNYFEPNEVAIINSAISLKVFK